MLPPTSPIQAEVGLQQIVSGDQRLRDRVQAPGERADRGNGWPA